MSSVKNISEAAHDLNAGCGCDGVLRSKRRQKRVFPGHRSGAALGVPTVGSSQRSVGWSAPVFGFGSFSGAGVRAGNVSREPAGDRRVPEYGATGVPCWFWQRIPRSTLE
jgi:hypothetical protein